MAHEALVGRGALGVLVVDALGKGLAGRVHVGHEPVEQGAGLGLGPVVVGHGSPHGRHARGGLDNGEALQGSVVALLACLVAGNLLGCVLRLIHGCSGKA